MTDQMVTTEHPEYLIPDSVQKNYAERAAHTARQQDRSLAEAWSDQIAEFKANHRNEIDERGADLAGWEYLAQWAEKTDPTSLLGDLLNTAEFRRLRVAESAKRDPEHTPVVAEIGDGTRQAAATIAADSPVKDEADKTPAGKGAGRN